MAQDIHGQYSGILFGPRDRQGFNTPDNEASETLQPYLPISYAAPWLPGLRQAQGHPIGGQVAISTQMIVGVDKNGYLVPAGMRSGTQAQFKSVSITNRVLTSKVATFTANNTFVEGQSVTISGYTGGDAVLNGTWVVDAAKSTEFVLIIDNADITTGAGTGTSVVVAANAGSYFAVKYSQTDADFLVTNVKTGAACAAGDVAVLAAPSDGVAGDVITFPDGSTYTILAGDLTFVATCNMFPGGKAKPVGIAVRDVWQNMGGVTVSSTTGGINYTCDTMIPIKFKFHNYMHEMGTAVRTEFYLRLTWIGNNTTDLATVASGLSISGYTQSNESRSFVHFTGAKGAAAGGLHVGALVKASTALGDSGHYGLLNTAAGDGADEKIGRVLAIQEMYPAKDYLNRVKTLWDTSKMGGTWTEPNKASVMMGGQTTGGLDYALNLGTNGLLKKALDQGKTPDAKMYTVVYVLIRMG